jgi:hypothetical protein
VSADGVRTNGYPTTDGKPMAETDQHRDQMVALIETLKAFYHDEPRVYVTGNMLLFYRRQQELAKKASELARDTDKPARTAQVAPLKPQEAEKAAEALKEGDPQKALQHQDQSPATWSG